MENTTDISPLVEFIKQMPAIGETISSEVDDEGRWFVKFIIDIRHNLAWRVVQELSNVVNLLSNDERLPTIFYPVSPPPYLNGGPADELIEWLSERLPSPVDDEYAWDIEDEEE